MVNPDLLLANSHVGRDFSTELKDGDIQQNGGGVRLANQEDANDEGPLLPQRFPFSVENPIDFVDRESVQDNATQPVPRLVAEHLVKLRTGGVGQAGPGRRGLRVDGQVSRKPQGRKSRPVPRNDSIRSRKSSNLRAIPIA
jgi:hypothetical protein